MRNSTHELLGVSAALVAARVTRSTPVGTAGLAAAALYGSWIFDIDRLGSRIHRRSLPERRFLVLGLAAGLLRAPAVALAAACRHRGATHSVLACAIVAAASGLLFRPLGASAAMIAGVGVALGYASHVLADGCTPSGVPLLFPIRRRKVWLVPGRLRVPTGSLRELVIAGAALRRSRSSS